MLAYETHTEAVAQHDEEGIDLFAVILPLARRWRWIAGLTLGFALLTVLGSLFIPTKYTAYSTFLLDTQDSNATGGSGMNIIFGRQADPTLSLLASNTLLDAVVKQTRLADQETEPKRKSPLFLRNEVRGETYITKNPDGVFFLRVTDKKSERAIDLANAYLVALQYMNDKMNFEAAAHSREFYEAQVQSERNQLERAEKELAAAQQRTGLVQPQNQTSIVLGTIASLRAQRTGLDVQLASALAGATEQNPAVVRLRTQIAELQAKENSLQGSLQGASQSNVPTQNLELQRLQRNVTYHESLVASLGAQFERARIQESYTSGRVRVVDRAAWPAQRALPNRMLLGLLGGVAGLLLGVIMAAILHWKERLATDPTNRQRMAQLRLAMDNKSRG